MQRKGIWGSLPLIVLVSGLAWGLTNLHTSQAQASRAVTTYKQWQKAYVAGKSQKYVKANNGQGATTAFSEGQGYGMLAAVLAAKKGANTRTTFNQLYKYYRAHRISSSLPLMQWKQTKRAGKMTSVGSEKNSATDGDLDIAYALILADKKWGSKQVNYKQAAKKLLAAIKAKEINPTTALPTMGNWATSSYDRSKLRTSDLLTGYFKTFAKYTKDKRWTTVAKRSQIAVKKLSARHKTGLFPDFIYATGSGIKLKAVKPYAIESGTDNQYGYNACRVPWRLAQTYKMSKDAVTKRALTKQLTFFNKKKKVTAVYTLGGKAVNQYVNTAFTAPVNFGARTLKKTTLKTKTAKQLPKSIEKKNYYSATIQVLTALQ
ncbi:glycosyl hydrolase family 8 [Levilactobacillus brevis]|uniref:glycosyl hydrolase family 8 n=1 Tax=Levilactobacillus brevis TaxID=1580 RepID=UPI000E092C60|nr:glycosyl hydrolase family 8 [Levilactobacillus brevis]MCM6800084.1 glycosyl hydrolase family 8 [Levilactobacillus brevis]MCM6801217.1 glycosyl hydrolase family 8 [Levilactobacillus brevis]MCM6804512.1 glycosyl hydrolase family 8 [Levilactobacillus brevis]MCM6808125.1 glycosyl hydrolase family 8 [Levilactobacillus brevis]MCM6814011.1 glycosyl hydrolase family 8 [Levilactobacillus brevis]